jgi:hypothetical protein
MWQYFYLVLCAGVANGASVYLRLNGTDTGSCGSFSSPCKTILQTVVNSNVGDIIFIGSGTFTGKDNVNITINGRSIKNEGLPFPTIDCLQGNTYGLKIESSGNTTSIYGISIANCALGGLLISSSVVNVTNCTITNNSGNGGITVIKNGNLALRSSVVTGNVALKGGGVQVKQRCV